MLWASRIVLALLGGALLACSRFGESDSEPDFTYGEVDMQALVVGTWSGSWTTLADNSKTALTLEIFRPPGTRSSPSCDSREFSVATADDVPEPGSRPACMSISHMVLDGLLSVHDRSFESAPLAGGMTVPSLNLSFVDLDLRHASGMVLIAQWNSDAWEMCRADGPDGAVLAECTLDSRASP